MTGPMDALVWKNPTISVRFRYEWTLDYDTAGYRMTPIPLPNPDGMEIKDEDMLTYCGRFPIEHAEWAGATVLLVDGPEFLVQFGNRAVKVPVSFCEVVEVRG